MLVFALCVECESIISCPECFFIVSKFSMVIVHKSIECVQQELSKEYSNRNVSALARWLSWLEHHPVPENIAGLVLVGVCMGGN